MKAGFRYPKSKRFQPLALLIALLLVTGCESSGFRAVDFHRPYKPDNIFSAGGKPDKFFAVSNQLPGDVKRVAVLPLACDARQTDLTVGRESLEPILFTELVKVKRFEVVQISREQLWRSTGRTEWSGDEILPADFLDLLKRDFACDAVLFSQLTEFRASPPLAVGWRLKLVDVRQRKTIWAADEPFDAGQPAVIAGARHYERREQMALDGDTSGWLAVNSPRWFGQYAVASLLDTLPAR